MTLENFTSAMKNARLAAIKNKSEENTIRANTMTTLWASAAKTAKTELRDVTQEDITHSARRMLKDQMANLELVNRTNREDAKSKILMEIEILEAFIPKQDTDAISAAIEDSIANLKPEQRNAKSMGLVIGRVKKAVGGDLDMSLVSKMVKDSLGLN